MARSTVFDSLDRLAAESGDDTRQSIDEVPSAYETPAMADTRQYQQQSQRALYGRVKAEDLASRDVAYTTTPQGQTREVTDSSGVPLTNADKTNRIAYDSTGRPVDYSQRDSRGRAVVQDAYATTPETTDPKTGDTYKIRRGLPWQWTGEDPAIKAQIQAKQTQKLNSQAYSALGGEESDLSSAASAAGKAAKASGKQFKNLATTDPGLVGEQFDPTADPATLRAQIEQAYNREYGSRAANEKPYFGGGKLSVEAERIRRDIDQRKAAALEALDAHVTTQQQAAQAQAQLDTIKQQRTTLRGDRLAEINQERQAAGLPPVGLGAATPTAPSSPQSSASGAPPQTAPLDVAGSPEATSQPGQVSPQRNQEQQVSSPTPNAPAPEPQAGSQDGAGAPLQPQDVLNATRGVLGAAVGPGSIAYGNALFDQSANNPEPTTGAANFGWRTAIIGAHGFTKAIEGMSRFVGLKDFAEYLKEYTGRQEAALAGQPVKGDSGQYERLGELKGAANVTANVAGGLIGMAPAITAGAVTGNIPGLIAIGAQAMAAASAEAHDKVIDAGGTPDQATHAAGWAAAKTLPTTLLFGAAGAVTGKILKNLLPLETSAVGRAAAALGVGTAVNLGAQAAGQAAVGDAHAPTIEDAVNAAIFAVHGAAQQHTVGRNLASARSILDAKNLATAQSIIDGTHPEMTILNGVAEGAGGRVTPEQQAQAAQEANKLRAVAAKFVEMSEQFGGKAADYIQKQGYKVPGYQAPGEAAPAPESPPTEKPVTGREIPPEEPPAAAPQPAAPKGPAPAGGAPEQQPPSETSVRPGTQEQPQSTTEPAAASGEGAIAALRQQMTDSEHLAKLYAREGQPELAAKHQAAAEAARQRISELTSTAHAATEQAPVVPSETAPPVPAKAPEAGAPVAPVATTPSGEQGPVGTQGTAAATEPPSAVPTPGKAGEQAPEVTPATPKVFKPESFTIQNGRGNVEVGKPYEVGGKPQQTFSLNGQLHTSFDSFAKEFPVAAEEISKRNTPSAKSPAVEVPPQSKPIAAKKAPAEAAPASGTQVSGAKPILTDAKLHEGGGGQIALSFDASGHIPTVEELKQHFKDAGFTVDVTKFKTNLISGSQGKVNFRVEGLESTPTGNVRNSGEQTKKAFEAIFGGTIKNKSALERSAPLSDRFQAVWDHGSEKLGMRSEKPADVLHDAARVKITEMPKGTKALRVTDKEGRITVEMIGNITKGANVLYGAGPYRKVEAGTFNNKKQFVPLKGQLTVTDASKPVITNALQKPSTGEVLQRQPGEDRPESGGRVEPSQQGKEAAPAGKAESQSAVPVPVNPSPEVERVTKTVRAFMRDHHADELKALDHPNEPQIGETRAGSGIETDTTTGRIIIDPEKLAKHVANLGKGGQEWLKRTVAEEVIHVGTVRYAEESPANRAKLMKLTQDKELMEQAEKAYGKEWKDISDFAKAAEAARILIQGPENLTEGSYRSEFLKDFLKWLKAKLGKLSKATRELIEGIEAKLGRAKPAEKPAAAKLTEVEQAKKQARDDARDAFGDLLGAAKPRGFRASIADAYVDLVNEDRFKAPAVMISEVQQRSGVPMEKLKEFLAKESAAGRIVLSAGDWSIATPEQRLGVINEHGKQQLQMRLMEPIDTSADEATAPAETTRQRMDAKKALAAVAKFNPGDPKTWPADLREGIDSVDKAEYLRRGKEAIVRMADLKKQTEDKDRFLYAATPEDANPLSETGQWPTGNEEQRNEKLMQEAEAAGLKPSVETIKGVIRKDPAAMDKLRAMIKAKTGRDAIYAAEPKQSYDSTFPDIDTEKQMKLAKSITRLAKVTETPEEFAKAIDEFGSKARNYVQSFWSLAKAFGAKGPAEPDWASIYEPKEATPEKAAEPAKPLTADQEYDAAREAANVVSHEFGVAQKKYRAKEIGDDEFLAAKKKHDAAQQAFDAAETKFIAAKNAEEKSAKAKPARVEAEQLSTPKEAVAEVTNEVSNPDNSRSPKEIKAELISRIKDAISKAPDETELNDKQSAALIHAKEGISVQTKVYGESDSKSAARNAAELKTRVDAAAKAGVKQKEIKIPGDGTFKVWNTKQVLEDMLKRVEKIEVNPKPYGSSSQEGRSIPSEAKLLAKQADNQFPSRDAAVEWLRENAMGATPSEKKMAEKAIEILQSGKMEALAAADPGAAPENDRLGAANPFVSAKKQFADEVKAFGVKDAIKSRHDSIENLSDYSASHVSNSIEMDYPDKKDREAAPFVIEGGRDPARLAAHLQSERQKIATSRDPKNARKYLPVIDHAIANQTSIAARRDNHDRLNTRSHARVKATGREVGTVDDYVRRVLDPPEAIADALPNPPFSMGGGQGKSPKSFTKGRVYETLGDAIHAGQRPQTTDLSLLDHDRIAAGEKLIEQDALLEHLENTMSPTDGKPIIQPMEFVKKLNGKTEAQLPKGTRGVQVFGRQVAVHDQYAGLLQSLNAQSALRQSIAGRLALWLAGFAKHGTLVFDTFHGGRLLYKMVTSGGGTGIGPGVAAMNYSDADLPRAVALGRVRQKDADWAIANRPLIDRALRSGANIGRVADNLWDQAKHQLPIAGPFNKWLFKRLAPAAMVQSWVPNYERNLRRPGFTPEQAARQTSKEMNAQFGNLRSQGIFQSRTAHDIANLIALAPQWTVSQFINEVRAYAQLPRFVKGVATGKGFSQGNAARAMIAGALALFAINQLINFLSRGKPTWENEEDGHKLDAWMPGGKRGFWFNPFEISGEYLHATLKYAAQHENPVDIAAHIASNKLSPIARGVKEGVTGRDYAGRHFLTNADRARAAVTGALPMPLPLNAFLEKDPRQPLGYRMSRQSGSIEKQILQGAGMKVTAAQSPRTQMFELAQPFRADRGTSDAAGEYTSLRQALDNDDTASAKSEIQWLLKRGKTPDMISRALGIHKDGSVAPEMFTGGADREREMLRALSPAEKKIYVEAQRQHVAVAMRYLRIAPGATAAAKPAERRPFNFH